MASLRPNRELVWRRISPSPAEPDGPVLYTIIIRSSATANSIPKISSNYTLTNSLLTDNGTQVAIGGLSISSAGIVNFAGGQTFSGDGSALTNLTGANVTGTVNTAFDSAQLAGKPSAAYAQVAANNVFTGAFNSFLNNSNIFPTLAVRNNGTGGILTGSNGSGATVFFFDNAGNETLTANNGNIYLGDAGCTPGFTAIGFGNSGMSGCANFSLAGDGRQTILNMPPGGAIDFRENNRTQLRIVSGGDVYIGTGVNGDGLGFKHKRVNVSVPAGSQVSVVIPWFFVDANYTVVATLEYPSNTGGNLRVDQVYGKSASSVTVLVENTGGSNQAGIVDVIAIHD